LTGGQGPKYLALSRALRDAVRRGDLPEGTQLPPVRDLAWRLGVTPGTVARAYQIGTQDGLLEAVVGRGTFVAARTAKLGPVEPLHVEARDVTRAGAPAIDMRSPSLPDVGQTAAISAALHRVADRVDQEYLGYPSLKQDRALRSLMADWLSDRALGAVGADDIALTFGGQNAIVTALQICLRGDRPAVFCEELTYPGFRHAIRLNRGEVVPIAMDDFGMRADALDAACRKTGGRVVCLTPEAQNPTAVRMPPERRAEIVRVARTHDLQIIEDDCYSVADAVIPSLRAVAPERTWHLASLSKSIAAGLRFGAIVAPAGLGEAARVALQHGFFGLSRPLADIVEELMQSGDAQRLKLAVREDFARRLQIALNALGRYQVTWQPGLSFLWLRLPSGWRASTFTRQAEGLGVLIRSADEYALVDGHAPNAVRIALAGNVTIERFEGAMNTLARLLDNPSGDLAM
jgi:DNA-binding transcriptional MocR family regulator